MRSEEKLVLLFGRLMELLRERSDAADDLKAALRGLEEVVAERSYTLRVDGSDLTVDGVAVDRDLPFASRVATQLSAHQIAEVRFGHRSPSIDLLHLARAVALDVTAYPVGHDVSAAMQASGVTTVTVLLGEADAVAEERRRARLTDALESAGVLGARTTSPPVDSGVVRPDTGKARDSATTRTLSGAKSPGSAVEQLTAGATGQTLQRQLDAIERELSDALDGGRLEQAVDGLAALIGREAEADEESRRAFGVTLRRLLAEHRVRRFAPLLLDDLYSADVQAIIVRAGQRGTAVLLDLLVAAPTYAERKAYLGALRQVEEGTEAIAGMLRRPEWFVIRNMADLAGDLRISEAVEALGSVADHPDDRVRRSVGVALAKIATPGAAKLLNRLLQDPEDSVKIAVFREVGGSACQGLAMPLVLGIEREQNHDVRVEFYRALGRIGTPAALDALKKAAVRSGGLLTGRRALAERLAAVEALALADSDGARNILRTLSDDRSRDVRDAAKRALGTGR